MPADPATGRSGIAESLMSQLAVKIETKQFVITSELTPPKGTDLSGIEAKATLLSPHVDAFNVTDSHLRR